MADPVDHVNMNDAMFWTNTLSVKEEQCQEDSYVEDKVYISKTTTIDIAELQDPVLHGKIKHQEESTCLDNIKTELVSFEVTEVQSDNVKVEEGISADDFKNEFNNGLVYCENCEAYYEDYCIECRMLVYILNKNPLNSADNGAREDIPNEILEIQDSFGQTGIYALRIIPAGVMFGPFSGLSITECLWEMKGEKFVLDNNKSQYLNWMQYINPTRNICDGNMHVFQSENNIYYESTRQIQAGEELLVYFGEEHSPNNIVRLDFVATMKDIGKDVYACTFCCLGFTSKSHLAKHKTVCVRNVAGRFSNKDIPVEHIEENENNPKQTDISYLTQCPFCKIHMDLKEYSEHHMAFCSERNARNCFLPTPPAKQGTTSLSLGQKRCPRETYKCEQCKYRTKYQADLREHSKQHSQVKIYKCETCNARFNTKESRRLHVENTHAYVGGKDDQEHSTTDYRITNVKVEQSSSQDQKKIFKCSMCVFRAKCKQYLTRHIKTIHLKKLDFKCHSCEYRTNRKDYLGVHIRSKHLRQFNFKCDSCKYGTNIKSRLQIHINSKHLKQFNVKCDSCEYRTNNKCNLEEHMKTKHLNEFRFRCGLCEYRTNRKDHLEKHIGSKHLRKLNFKCDSCEYGTNRKSNLEVHIKNKHLKQFDYKCGSCEFKTNRKDKLQVHIKVKHLKKFNYSCDKYEINTSNKTDLKRHIGSKYLKEYDLKCVSCEYRANRKRELEVHIKTKHLKQFDFKCDS